MELEEESQLRRPRALDTEEYVKARVDQIAELLDVIDNPALGLGEVTSGPRTVFQRLPRHMRRRAMSHNVKRLPRTLRPIAARHTQRTLHRKKPPSRKWRRRPSRLLKRWVRLKRKAVWLETHIWHAKRFHMEDLWGYKLPMRSCQRGFRPNYRCCVNSAVVLDQSYLCCLQFVATNPNISHEIKIKTLIDTLSPFCQKQVSPTFANPGAISGQLEVSVMLFTPGKYPYGFLGPARISWTPDGSLNLWIHPTMENDFLRDFGKLPNIFVVPPHQMKHGMEMETDKPIKLFILRNHLCRFHLSGSKALSYLHNALKLVSDDEMSNEFRSTHHWWRNLAPNLLPGNVKNGQIVSLLVEDPRLFRAQPSTSTTHHPPPSSSSSSSPPPPPPTTSSLFWNWSHFQKHTLPQRLGHAEFEKLCAGKLARPRRTEFKIPILLVFHRSSAAPLPASGRPLAVNTSVNGVDLICPAGVGYDFWLALQFSRCRAIGIRDKSSLDFEAGLGTFPDDAPDCSAGRAQAQAETAKLMEKHKRKPLNRRIEYAKALKVNAPFAFEWTKLVADWGSTDDDDPEQNGFFVIRDRLLLRRLQLWLSKKDAKNILDEIPSDSLHYSALVPVTLKMLHRGVPKRLALISLPTESDLELMRKEGERVEIKETKKGKLEENDGQEEEENNGIPQKAAKLVPEYISLLESSQESFFPVERVSRIGKLVSLGELFPDVDKDQLRRARNVRKRRHKQEKRRKKKEAGMEEDEMEKEVEEEEKETSSRQLIGRVVRGDFAFTSAQGIAFGFIPFGALREIGPERIVLLRNTTSPYHHPARIAIHNSLSDF